MNEAALTALQESVTNYTDLYYKGILYAEFGMRKTTTALRCMQKKAVLLHVDRGWSVIHNHPDEFDELNTVPVAYKGLSQVHSIVEAITESTPPFDNVDLIVCDTLSQMQEEYIDFLLENTKYSGNFREKAVAKPGKKFEDVEIPGMADYHLARNKLRPVIRLLSKSPVNVIYLAHLREPGPIERSNGKIERRPNITEALYKVVARDATFIGMMERDKKESYSINFKPDNRTSAKSQIPALTDKTISINDLPDILHAWTERR